MNVWRFLCVADGPSPWWCPSHTEELAWGSVEVTTTRWIKRLISLLFCCFCHCVLHLFHRGEARSAAAFWLTLKISSGHFSPSLLIPAKSIYWHYKTDLVFNTIQPLLHVKVKCNGGLRAAFSHPPGCKGWSAHSDIVHRRRWPCCSTLGSICSWVNVLNTGQCPQLPSPASHTDT